MVGGNAAWTRAAIAYAERLSWAVLPCRGKRPPTAHGVHDVMRQVVLRITDLEKIKRYFLAGQHSG